MIPVLTASGQRGSIRVAALTSPEDAPVALAADRPDFNAALAQFLVTLLQYAFAPETEDEWRKWLHAPPAPDEIDLALAVLHDGFELEGDHPFMQDPALGIDSSEARPLEALLLESPGENALKNNTDLFIKRQAAEPWEPVRAALALLTLQINAPSGGQGHRTSLRGGGPLTTLLWPDTIIGRDGNRRPATLWQRLWCNVLPSNDPLPPDHHIALPWTADCITSEGGRTVLEGWPRAPTQNERNALCGFATPRRILLRWEGEGDERRCIGYITRNYGANYPSDQFSHPASPYYRDAKKARLPQHIGEAGFSYQHFTSYCTLPSRREEAPSESSAIVAHALESAERREALGDTASLWACGYAMDNMKVLAWHEAHYPLFPHVPEARRVAMWLEADKLVRASDNAESQLGKSIRKLGGDARLAIRGLRDQTEAAFYTALNTIACDTSAEQRFAQRGRWLQLLLRVVMHQFAAHAERSVDAQSRLDHVEAAAKERLLLWRSLNKDLHGALEIKMGKPAPSPTPASSEETA